MEKEKIRKICDKVYEKFDKKVDNFESESFKAMKGFCAEEMEIYKFLTEQELKNIDVILDILKFITSLSISIFVASLTTIYFSKEIYIIIYINIVLIILLIIFINARNHILLRSKKILLEIFKESADITRDNINSKHNDIKKKLKEQKEIIKDLKK